MCRSHLSGLPVEICGNRVVRERPVAAKIKMKGTRIDSTLKAKLMLAVVACVFAVASSAFAQTGVEYPNTVPGGAEGPMPGPPPAGGDVVAPAPSGGGTMRTYENPAGDEGVPSTTHATHHHAARHRSSEDTSTIEPAEGHLKLLEDSYAYERPAKSSKKVQPVETGKFVNVIGTSRYYAQVKLKNSEIAYVPLSALQLVTPTDKSFLLTADASVLSEPNHAAKKLAEVHQGKNVHVVGIALSYMKIRMKDGVEGYIPITALQ
jgi:hypothetical protein